MVSRMNFGVFFFVSPKLVKFVRNYCVPLHFQCGCMPSLGAVGHTLTVNLNTNY